MSKLLRSISGSGKMIILFALIIVIIAIGIFFILNSGKKESIKIGAILSISGSGGLYGKDVRDGMILAADEINSRGGINGREIELITEDSQTNPEEGKKAFSKIESMHHPILYVSTLSSVSLALAPMAEKKEVVLLGLVTAAPELTQGKRWVFRYWPTAKTQVQTIHPVIQELKVKKLGVLYLKDGYGTSIFKLIKTEFEKTGGVIMGEGFNIKTTDFTALIANLKNSDAIYCIGFNPHLKNIFRQLKEENFNGFVLSTNAATSLKSLPEANGVYVTDTIIEKPDYLYSKKVKEKYEARYSKPLSDYAAVGYDFVRLFSNLMEDNEISRKNLKRVLEQGFTYPGVLGDIRLKQGDHDINIPLYPARIETGKIKFR